MSNDVILLGGPSVVQHFGGSFLNRKMKLVFKLASDESPSTIPKIDGIITASLRWPFVIELQCLLKTTTVAPSTQPILSAAVTHESLNCAP
jgi:hypothetical protein